MISDTKVKVVWLMDYVLIREGMAQARSKGDEDIMTRAEAKPKLACKLIEIVASSEADVCSGIEVLDEPDESYDS